MLVVSKQSQLNSNINPDMTANLDNIHEIYNLFSQKNCIHISISNQKQKLQAPYPVNDNAKNTK